MARPTEDDDDDIDLGISLETVATIVDHARAVQGLEEGEPEQLSEDDDSEAALLQDDPDDMTEETVVAFIDGLNADEQASLIAIAWTGRGDYTADEWDEALRLALERNEAMGTGAYLMGMEMLGDLLAEGVAAFGLSIEDIER